jgi:2-polyprenyl-3-methyl-5-hydroxy-6-metoxy-1,4-benzoquinol methylase
VAKGNLRNSFIETGKKRLLKVNAIRSHRPLAKNSPEIQTYTQRPKEFDWIRNCRELTAARKAEEDRLKEKAGLTSNSWDAQAGLFRQTTLQEIGKTDRLLEFLSTYVTPKKTVLDIGAGTGRHALPIAKLAKSVTAVEPSEGMRRFMKVEAVRLQIKNLRIVPQTWDEAEVEPCDIAYCTHVSFAVTDMGRFLEKLQDHAREYCVVVSGTTQQNLRLLELWKLVHGEERCPHPAFIEHFNAIYQAIGVCPNVEITQSRIGRYPVITYGSFEEAVNQVARQILLSKDAPEMKIVRSYLKDRLVTENGRLFLPGPPGPDVILWWDNRPGSSNLARITGGLWKSEKNLSPKTSLRNLWR